MRSMIKLSLVSRVCRLRLAFLLLAAGVQAGCSSADAPNADEEQPMLKVRVVHPQPVAESDQWHLVADVVPEKQSPLSFQVPGRLSQRLVEPGDVVVRDQVLMMLDDSDLRLKLKALEAQVAAAESDLSLARKEWQRIRQLFARKLVSQDAVDNAQNRLNNVRARLDALRWQLKEAQRQLDYSQLRAPDDGVVIAILSDIGTVVGPGQPVLHMQVGTAVEFAVNVPAARLHALPRQAEAEINGQRIAVTQRYLSPQADPITRTWPARYHLAEPSALKTALVPGDFATMHFRQPVTEPLLKLPLAAVFSENGRHYVWQVQQHGATATVHKVGVTAVRTFPTTVWVRGPLKPQDQLVAMGAHLLSEGQTVRVATP